jgi:hypothetical protein
VNITNRTAIRLEYDQLNDVGDKDHDYTAGNFATLKVEAIYSF